MATLRSYRRSEEHTSELQSQSNLVCRIIRSEEHTSELQSQSNLVCRLLLEKKKKATHHACAMTSYTVKNSKMTNPELVGHEARAPATDKLHAREMEHTRLGEMSDRRRRQRI